MNDLQIEYFLAVARNLSFTKTAEELYVTQPAVSKQISLLEKELDAVLFDRTNKNTELTEAGKLFQRFFEDYKKSLEKAKDAAKILNQSKKGHVRLACLEGWNISGFFPELLSVFKEKYPNVEIDLDIYSVKGLIQALKAEKVDAIMTLAITLKDVEGLSSIKMVEIPKILLYSHNHALNGKADLKMSDFKDETFFVMSAEEVSYASRLVKEYCLPYGFEPNVQCVRNIEAMSVYVQNGLGVAISDSWSREKDNAEFCYIELNEKHEISLSWLTKHENETISILANELKLLLNSKYPLAVG